MYKLQFNMDRKSQKRECYHGYGHEWCFESGFTMGISSTFLFSWIEVMLLTPLYTYNDF